MKITVQRFLLSVAAATLLLGAAGPAQAAQYDIKQMTPEVRRAIEQRQARYGSVQSQKASGNLGESNQGYLEVLGGGGQAASLAQAENADRRVIYTAIVSQNQLPPSALSQVETAFAEVQRDKAQTGDSVQLPSGQWTKK